MFYSGFGNAMFSIAPIFIAVIFLIVIVTITFSAGKGVKEYFSNNSKEEVTMPARIITKRAHVWGGHHDTSASTSYYITFEDEQGNRAEFSVGSKLYGMYAEGDTGMLTHQGTRFLDFERDRF